MTKEEMNPLNIIEEANSKTLDYFNKTYVSNLELVQSLKTELFELEVQIETLEKTRDLYTYHIDTRRNVFSPIANENTNTVTKGKQIAMQIKDLEDARDVKDHCYGILAVIEKGRVGEVYNLGGHNEKANIEIVKIILDKLNKPESLITYVADRHGHDQRYAIDPQKAMDELGWRPTTMFKDGIVLTIDWYMSDEGRKWTTQVFGTYCCIYQAKYLLLYQNGALASHKYVFL